MKYLVDIHHGFGDVLHMMPALRTIKKYDLNAHIALIVSNKAIIDAFKTQKIVSEFILADYKSIFKYKCSHILKHYDYGIVAPCIENQKKAIRLLQFFCCRKIIYENPNNRDKIMHRVDKNIMEIEKMGYLCDDPYPSFFIPEREKKYADSLFPVIKTRIAICIGGNYETLKKGFKKIRVDIKRWPIGYYHELLTKLTRANPEIDFLLIGGKKDEEEFWRYDGKYKIDRNTVVDFLGKTTFLQSGAILEKCTFAFGNDTGMIHMAAALGVPTMTIFCSTDPRKIGAYAKNAKYMEESLPCKYCYISEKTFLCKDRKCLTQIKPQRAFEEITGMMKDCFIQE